MLNFIQANYKTVSLADMAAQFNLTEPYICKYIKEKSGKTFGELVTNAKMKKARTPVSYTHLDVYKRQRGDTACSRSQYHCCGKCGV